jgi:predicted DNA-binding protein with PD1-like motif
MHSKQIADNPKTIVVILDTGDEILSSLKSVAQTEHLASSSLKGDRRTERCRTWLVQLGGKEV